MRTIDYFHCTRIDQPSRKKNLLYIIMKRNYICDYFNCNRVFSRPNHLSQHKERFHISNTNRYKITNDELDVDVEVDESDENLNEIIEILNTSFYTFSKQYYLKKIILRFT